MSEKTKTSTWSKLYHGQTDWKIIHRWKLWFTISAVVILAGIGMLATRGLNMGIDFTGGTVWQVRAGGATTEEARNVMGRLGYTDLQVQEVQAPGGGSGGRMLRIQANQSIEVPEVTAKSLDSLNKDLNKLAGQQSGISKTRLERTVASLDGIEGPFATAVPADLKSLQDEASTLAEAKSPSQDDIRIATQKMDELASNLDEAQTTELRSQSQDVSDELAKLTGTSVSQVTVDSIGPSWGKQISEKAQQALIFFLLAIMLFITIRFEWKMALATIIALFHDLIVVVGIYAILQLPVAPATVVAFLTMLGFSIYDGIVGFDRVHENQKKLTKKSKTTYTDMANTALNQVLMRSLNTSITTMLPITSVLIVGSMLLGASTLREFGVALFLGLVSGIYSSIFIATPLLAMLKEREPRYKEMRENLEAAAKAQRAGGSSSGYKSSKGSDSEHNESEVLESEKVTADGKKLMAGSTAPPRGRKKPKR